MLIECPGSEYQAGLVLVHPDVAVAAFGEFLERHADELQVAGFVRLQGDLVALLHQRALETLLNVGPGHGKGFAVSVALRSCVLRSAAKRFVWIVVERFPKLLRPVLDVVFVFLCPNDWPRQQHLLCWSA